MLRVNRAPGADAAQVEAALKDALKPYPQFKLIAGTEYVEQNRGLFDSIFLAFYAMMVFLAVYFRYQTLSPGIFVFPLAFLLTFAAAMGEAPPQFASTALRSSWIATHVALIFTGYAALALSFAAGFDYIRMTFRTDQNRAQLIWPGWSSIKP